jgi:CO/xanthine dehydrogenase FAD-binding subunit
MSPIRAYHRPDTVAAAIELLHRDGIVTALIGGGTEIVAQRPGPDEVIDLQAAGLDEIAWEPPTLRFGATAMLRDLVDHESTPPVLRDLARREAPNTIRNASTIGGCVASFDAESPLLAGLVACSAVVSIEDRDGTDRLPLADLLGNPTRLVGAVITAVEVDVAGTGAHAATGRTPADRPIVCVAGWRSDEGSVVLAGSGIGTVPLAFDAAEADRLDPPTDFRGSAEYRRHIAGELAGRVLRALEAS